jgi:MFS family permease
MVTRIHGLEHQRQGRVKDPNLLIVFGVTLVSIMGVTSITPSLPQLAAEFNISPQRAVLVITYIMLPGILLTLLMGVVADRWGRKAVLVPCLLLFGTAGTACALAQDFDWLLRLRLIQGIGAAPLASLSFTLIGDLYEPKARTKATGYNAGVLSVGTATYPVVGGVLASIGWQFPFLLPILAVPVGVCVLTSLRSPVLDKADSILNYFSNALGCIRNRRVLALLLASFGTVTVLYGAYLAYFPFLIKSSFGGSPRTIGIIMSCMSVVTAITSSQVGKLARVFSEEALLRVSFVLYSLGLATMPAVSNLWLLLLPTIAFGLGHGLNIPSIQSLLAGSASTNERGAIMSLNGTVLRVGQTLGPLLGGWVSGIWGIGGAFYVGASIAASFFALLTVALPPRLTDSQGTGLRN